MNPLTAALFILFAGGMLSSHKNRYSTAIKTAIAIITFGILSLKISDLVFFTNFKPDAFLFTSNLKGNQMAVATVVNFVLIAVALYFSTKRGLRVIALSQLMSLLALSVSSIYICAYLFNLNSIIGVSVITPMAIHTAVCFILLGALVLFIHPRQGFMKTITSESVGGIVTRKTLPLIILIPFVIGYLSLTGQRKGLYNSEFSMAIFVVITSLLCAVIMWQYGKMINVIHRVWKSTESDLNSSIAETKNLNHEIETKNNVLTYTAVDLEGKIRQLEEFNKIVAHNLRGPAGSIQMLINMVLESDSDQEKLDFLALLKESSKDLIDTLTELVAIMEVRLNTQIPFDDCSFAEIISKVEHMLKGEMISKKASIVMNLKMPGLKYPKVYLESIFYNMISNALKYSKKDEQPFIEISSELTDNKTRLTFKDNGIGIDLARHSNQLFKLHQTFHQGYDSKGIGLFMTKNQIETFGGSISIKSEPGRGSEFTIIL
ncbi:sensor histidine kinase [Mucilaginibacter gilvus]|nr:HAMP domain-containing sensor histidine kinase [Mucilaginibacter gilvus]